MSRNTRAELAQRGENWCYRVGCTMLAAVTWFLGSASADESAAFQAYQANWEQAQQAFADNDYATAAGFFEKVAELLPFEPSTQFQLARCFARLGETDKAFAALAASIRNGWDDSQRIEQAEDLSSLRNDARFSRILKDAEACQNETLVIYSGKSVDTAKPAPLIVLLHGLGAGPRSEVPYWMSVSDELGAVLVAPRGVTKVGPMVYGWQRSGAKDSKAADYFELAAADQRIADAVTRATSEFKIDRNRIFLAGFSQGGGVALHLLGTHPETYCGAIAICGLHQPQGVDHWKAVARKRPVRVFIAAGKLDPLLPRSQELMEQLRAAQVILQYDELSQTGHELPPDCTEMLCRAVKFVLGQQEPER